MIELIQTSQHGGQHNVTRAIQKVKNVCTYSPCTCSVAADHRFLVFSVMLKSTSCNCKSNLIMWLGAEIAVAMAVPIENPANCDVWGIINFLQADEILGYLAEALWQTQALLHEQFHWDIFKHPPYSLDLAPSDFSFFQKWRSTLLVKASQMMIWRMLSWPGAKVQVP